MITEYIHVLGVGQLLHELLTVLPLQDPIKFDQLYINSPLILTLRVPGSEFSDIMVINWLGGLNLTHASLKMAWFGIKVCWL